MNIKDFTTQYWNHYLMLEKEFLSTTNYVAIDKWNEDTYSIEYAKLFLSICSEIDVVCKEYCKFINDSEKPSKITEYSKIILKHKNSIASQEVSIINSEMSTKPWENWDIRQPIWWKLHNKVKHQRTDVLNIGSDKNSICITEDDPNYKKYSEHINVPYYKFSCQGNVIESLGGLCILCMEFYYDLVESDHDCKLDILPENKSKLFLFNGRESKYIYPSDLYMVVTDV